MTITVTTWLDRALDYANDAGARISWLRLTGRHIIDTRRWRVRIQMPDGIKEGSGPSLESAAHHLMMVLCPDPDDQPDQ